MSESDSQARRRARLGTLDEEAAAPPARIRRRTGERAAAQTPTSVKTAGPAAGEELVPRSGKGRKLPAELLTPDEVRALIRACSPTAPTGIRNRALLVVLYRSGLRVGEALALYPKDVDPRRGTVRVLHGKGDKDRLAVIDDAALAVVERWLVERRRLGVGPRRRLFCTLAGGPLAPSYVRQLLPRLAGRAGIDKRVHAHGLRHACAIELDEEGHPLAHIRDQLGHSSAAVTDRYLRRINPGARIDALRRRTWSL